MLCFHALFPPINEPVSYSFSLVVRKGLGFCPLEKIINHRQDESITIPSDGQRTYHIKCHMIEQSPMQLLLKGARCPLGPLFAIVHVRQHFIQFSMSFLMHGQ